MSKCYGGYSKSVRPKRAFAAEKVSGYPDSQKEERAGWRKKFTTPEDYIKEKLRMLRQDMYIEPTEEEIARLNSKTTEYDIDIVVRGIVARAWS